MNDFLSIKSVVKGKTIFFSNFDSLIVNPFWNENDFFQYIERVHKVDGFAKARQEYAKKGQNKSCMMSLEEVYSMLPSEFKNLQELEESYYKLQSHLDSEFLSALDSLKDWCDRVILIIDSCYTIDTIQSIVQSEKVAKELDLKIVEKRNYPEGNKLIYEAIMKQYGLDPNQVLIVYSGDSLGTDSCFEHDSQVYKWTTLKERYATTHPNEMKFLKSNPGIGASFLVAMDAIQWMKSANEEYWFTVGRRFGGPAALMFTLFLISKSEGYEKLVFCSRDGYIPMKVYEALCDNPKEYTYLYTSRLMSQMYGDTDYGDSLTIAMFMDYLNVTVHNNVFGFPNKKECREFYNNNKARIHKIHDEGYSRLSQYYQEEIGAAKCLLIDATTTKFTSKKDIEKYTGRSIAGCYYSVCAEGSGEYTCYADRAKQSRPYKYVNLIEFFFNSHESQSGYVREEYVHNDDLGGGNRQLTKMVHDGIMEYVYYYSKMFKENFIITNSETVDRWMDLLIKNRTTFSNNIVAQQLWPIDARHRKKVHLIMDFRDQMYMLMIKTITLLHG